jgi:Ca2+-binding RTX toxin-like protein
MPSIYGTHARWGHDNIADRLWGTGDSDTIFGFGGDDLIFASAGSDFVYGGSGNDQIFATHNNTTHNYVAYWGSDYVQGGSGNDVIDYSKSMDSVVAYGDSATFDALIDGNDRMFGSFAGDFLYGGGGNDMIRGGDGADQIYGDIKNNAGAGNDMLIGDRGADILTGGNGNDTFVYFSGDSYATRAGHDVITDFDGIHDKIDIPGWATAYNYAEKMVLGGRTAEESWDLAKADAATLMGGAPQKDVVFLTNGKDGFLFADTDGDNYADIGITLLGVKSLAQFDYHYVV